MRFPEAAFTDDGFVEATETARPHLQRARAPRHDGRPRRWRTPIRSASARTRSATTARSCIIPRLLEPGVPQPVGDDRLRALFNFLMPTSTPATPVALAATARGGRDRRPLPVLRAQLPLLRTASGCSPTGSASSSCTGCTGPGSCSSPPSASPTSRGTACRRTCCSCSTRDDLEEPHAERLVGDDLGEARGHP